MDKVKVIIDKSEYNGLIAGCDYDIGVTIVNKDDPREYLFCLIGPSSTLWKTRNGSEKAYKIYFEYIKKAFEKEVFDFNEFKSILILQDRQAGSASAKSCPFGQ